VTKEPCLPRYSIDRFEVIGARDDIGFKMANLQNRLISLIFSYKTWWKDFNHARIIFIGFIDAGR
jgi:hypothetical protein